MSVLGKRSIDEEGTSVTETEDNKKAKTEELLRIGVVKRIMALDYESPDVTISPESIAIVSRSVCLFMQKFIEKVLKNNSSIVKNEKKNIVKYGELVSTSRKHKELQFLYDLLPEI